MCREISQCQAAGGFGKFLSAVTGQCGSKHFKDYFGLDGLTFGILDWTEDNLPMLLHTYQQKSAASFTATLGALALPIKDGCLDPKWACDNNKKGVLMCNATFRAAFEKALGTAEFQQAQAIEALAAYETRLKRFLESPASPRSTATSQWPWSPTISAAARTAARRRGRPPAPASPTRSAWSTACWTST